MNPKSPAEILREKALTSGHSEKLNPNDFEDNDPYKVCYRLLSNMTAGWRDIGLPSFPTESEAIELAKQVDPYFHWLFLKEDELDAFKRTYDFVSDVWRGETQ